MNGRHSTSYDLGWVARWRKTCRQIWSRPKWAHCKVNPSPRKAWPNRVAIQVFNLRLLAKSMKTSIYLRLRLARPFVHLRWLTKTCAHCRQDKICTQVDATWSVTSYFVFLQISLINLNASFSPSGHPASPNPNQLVEWRLLASYQPIITLQDMSTLKCFLGDLRVLARKLASLFGHPTQVSG